MAKSKRKYFEILVFLQTILFGQCLQSVYIKFLHPSINHLRQVSISPSLLGDNVSNPLKVGWVALVNRQANDLSHLIRVVRAVQEGYCECINSVQTHRTQTEVTEAIPKIQVMACNTECVYTIQHNTMQFLFRIKNKLTGHIQQEQELQNFQF